MSVAEEAVYEALKDVYDPELLVNIVDLGLIYGIKIEPADGKSKVCITMTMTTPACPYGPELIDEVKDAVGELSGVGEVDVQVTLNPPWTPDRMTEDARDELGMY